MADASGPLRQSLAIGRGTPEASVLVTEDDAVIGMYLTELLNDAGCVVLGPVESVADALAILNVRQPEAALLDYALRDGTAAPIARVLADLGVPFALLTGSDELDEHADELAFAPRVTKPFGSDAIEQMLRELLGEGARPRQCA